MIVLDSSAVVAILRDEPAASTLSQRLSIEARSGRVISAANYLEAGAVLAGRFPVARQGVAALEAFMRLTGTTVSPVNGETAELALAARIRWGKGFGSRNGLNFGDSFAYATAKLLDAPLLYIGDDFSITDVRSAL